MILHQAYSSGILLTPSCEPTNRAKYCKNMERLIGLGLRTSQLMLANTPYTGPSNLAVSLRTNKYCKLVRMTFDVEMSATQFLWQFDIITRKYSPLTRKWWHCRLWTLGVWLRGFQPLPQRISGDCAKSRLGAGLAPRRPLHHPPDWMRLVAVHLLPLSLHRHGTSTWNIAH